MKVQISFSRGGAFCPTSLPCSRFPSASDNRRFCIHETSPGWVTLEKHAGSALAMARSKSSPSGVGPISVVAVDCPPSPIHWQRAVLSMLA